MTSIGVLGPGGVGGFLAAALARAGENVVVIARESTAAAIAANGISVRSVRLGDFVAHPRAVAECGEPVDVLLVATKAVGLDVALGRVTTDPGLVVPLLNGLDHMAVLRARFGADRVAAGTIRIESDRTRYRRDRPDESVSAGRSRGRQRRADAAPSMSSRRRSSARRSRCRSGPAKPRPCGPSSCD